MGLEINNLAFLHFGTEVDIRQSRCQHLRIDAEFFGPASRQRWPAYEKGRRTSRLERNRRECPSHHLCFRFARRTNIAITPANGVR